jgi:hypothetical protein
MKKILSAINIFSIMGTHSSFIVTKKNKYIVNVRLLLCAILIIQSFTFHSSCRLSENKDSSSSGISFLLSTILTSPGEAGQGGSTVSKTTLASGLHNPVGIAVDSTDVYWTESDIGSSWNTGSTYVKKIGKNSGSVTTIASSSGLPNYVNTWSIAVDSNNVYWTESNQNSMLLNAVGLNGGAVTTLVSTDDLCGPFLMTMDYSSVYWSDTHDTAKGSNSIKKWAKNGGLLTTLAIGQTEPSCIAVNSSGVFWLDTWGGTINKVGINGGTAIILVTVPSLAYFGWYTKIAVDSSSVYWIDQVSGDSSINKISINGGALTTIVSKLDCPIVIAIDSTNIYWSNNGGGIFKVSKNGGTVTTLRSSPDEATYIIFDDTCIYWTDYSTINKSLK